MNSSLRCALIVINLLALVVPARGDSCLPPVDVDAILLSVDSFLERQMDRFLPLPGDYPPGCENVQLIQTYDFLTSDHTCVPPYWRADVYDTALAAFYFTRRGNLERARVLLDGIRCVQACDPFGDGRTRTSYRADDLFDLPCLPTIDDGSTGTGNMAWQGIALLHFYRATGEQEYLDAARQTAQWINDHTRQPVVPGIDPYGGFSLGETATGGPIGGTTKGRSTEHNVDVYAFTSGLYRVDQDPLWLDMALHARRFVQAMFDDVEGKYWLGTKENETTFEIEINYWPQSTDAQAWTALSTVDSADRASRALDWLMAPTSGLKETDLVCSTGTCEVPCAETCDACYCDPSGTSDCCYHGLKFTNAGEHIQTEVTASAAMALCLHQRGPSAQEILCNLERIRLTAPNHDPNGIGMVATPWCDCAPTGFDNAEYPNERHVASTVWTGLAFMNVGGDRLANALRPQPDDPIPTVSDWGVVTMGLLVLLAGTLVFRGHRRRATLA